MKISTIKRYSDVIILPKFEDRFNFLVLNGRVGEITFGGHRDLNQILYKTERWRHLRHRVIFRDNGCDLAHPTRPINGTVYIHHIEPITIEDILEERSCVFDIDNLISVSFQTHNALHYSNADGMQKDYVERKENDTCPWRC